MQYKQVSLHIGISLRDLEDIVWQCHREGLVNIHDFESRFWDTFPAMRLHQDSVQAPRTPAILGLIDRIHQEILALREQHPNLSLLFDALDETPRQTISSPLPFTPQKPFRVLVKGEGPNGQVCVMQLKQVGADVVATESRSDHGSRAFDTRYGSLSYKNHSYLAGLLGQDSLRYLETQTDCVRFSSTDSHSPNALRASTGTFQDVFDARIRGTLKVRVWFEHELPDAPSTWNLIVHTTGVSGRNRELQNDTLRSQAGFFSLPGLTTYAETAVNLEHTQATHGFVRENNYALPNFFHVRKHVTTGRNLGPVVTHLRASIPETERTNQLFADIVQAPTAAFVYYMRSKTHADEPTRFADHLKHSGFSITPDCLKTPLIEGDDCLHAFVGDASGQSHFVGGYGQNKGSIEAALLGRLVRAKHCLSELEAQGVSPKQLGPLHRLFTQLAKAEHEAVVELFFWNCVFDALCCHLNPTPNRT
ncbi:MAG: hypothetical protein AB7F28_00435 [Candidatus Margulisiibacteriota bacterium]